MNSETDHSVVILGWGKEKRNGKNMQYWLVRNSFGSTWGEQGDFKVEMGNN